jgi:hypothetical protein
MLRRWRCGGVDSADSTGVLGVLGVRPSLSALGVTRGVSKLGTWRRADA